jgi:hypothetical protein
MSLHDWIDITLFVGGIAATLGNLFLLRFFGGLDTLREKVALHAIEIRDNRTAIAEARTKVGLGSFPYTT